MSVILPESLVRVVPTLEEEQESLLVVPDVTPGGDPVHPQGGGGSLQLPGLGEILLAEVLGQPGGVPQQLVLVLIGRSVVVVIEAAGDLSLQDWVREER